MIDFSNNHLKDDVDALLQHIKFAAAYEPGSDSRRNALFSAGVRLMRLEKEIARMGDVIAELDDSHEAAERLNRNPKTKARVTEAQANLDQAVKLNLTRSRESCPHSEDGCLAQHDGQGHHIEQAT